MHINSGKTGKVAFLKVQSSQNMSYLVLPILSEAHKSFSIVFSLRPKKLHGRGLTCHPDNSEKLNSHIEDSHFHLLQA